MRRLAPLLVLLLAAGPAAAQTQPLDRLRLESVQQQNMRAQEQQNMLRRDQADANRAVAEQHRNQTQANLRGAAPLAEAQAAAIPDHDAQLRRLEDKELTESNARLKAITPAP